jgi:acyl-CoA reductase-like NAD-dependent aldehyde dehydrogenase
MQREIFGPILPIIEVEDVDEAIDFINARYSAVTVIRYDISNEISVIIPLRYMCSPQTLRLKRKV